MDITICCECKDRFDHDIDGNYVKGSPYCDQCYNILLENNGV